MGEDWGDLLKLVRNRVQLVRPPIPPKEMQNRKKNMLTLEKAGKIVQSTGDWEDDIFIILFLFCFYRILVH
ncbi:hypothetical protein HNR77_001434 [Paenibacillus sp. JGP012]|uniref:hypothetical protein n=1 Tax=Paenibacillus sp. JGP012 TaxID=2735914 RepID=UPI0016109E2B|nr:hypothetical protein [Paenibacillus sp. JGP012]MBB6020373.1 hypothetical protein [Paenibacillus sp. JGP012]